jgi:hypothetical protein
VPSAPFAERILGPHLGSGGKFNARRTWLAVVNAFEAKGLTAAHALVQAAWHRILRHTDYSYKTKEPTLWNPPQYQRNPSGIRIGIGRPLPRAGFA